MKSLLLLALLQVATGERKPNVVLIVTDDQDLLLHSLFPMRNVRELIANQGATFTNAFVNTPVCCPSRSTLLTGKYLHNTGVRNNSLEGNCSSSDWQLHHEPYTIASLLRNSNYSTFYAGKYLNEYGNEDCGGIGHVPDGYDWWMGLKGNSKYYDYVLSVNGTARKFQKEYLTDVLKSYALDFLNQRHVASRPFFMTIATPAPHAPFTPASRHANAFPDAKAVRTPSFNFSASDKHWLVRMPPKVFSSNVSALDAIQRNRLRTLLAVDELVKGITHKLTQIGVLGNTYLLFTSDNGFHIGQFVQPWDKRQPYETDIRVPLLIRGPSVRPKRLVRYPVSFVDFAPTILDMCSAQVPSDMDGRSFFDVLKNEMNPSKDDSRVKSILIEYRGEGNRKQIDPSCPWVYDDNLTECSEESWCKCQDARNNTYTCVRNLSTDNSVDFKFCQFEDDENFIEAYDLKSDPYELVNVYKAMKEEEIQEYKSTLDYLSKCNGLQCNL